ncbi:hypothetical protein GCM10022252_75270 [Streptosporangium oxazolinicum]|uniref:Uncharacterized protein n=1 Tax=Streptosporangium oxazolinicum TaxID=909287 RepID=A0ABP8BKH2_9ACTN
MPTITADQAIAALAALGVSQADDAEKPSTAFLVGSLLALVEGAFWQDLNRSDLLDAHVGYMAVVSALASSEEGAARGWAVLLNDRINRTAIEVQEATEGNGRAFIEVAGPAMLVAANLLNVLNHHALTQELMAETIATADHNLKVARRNLGALRGSLRGDGFDLPS